jgi:hypothetical protein
VEADAAGDVRGRRELDLGTAEERAVARQEHLLGREVGDATLRVVERPCELAELRRCGTREREREAEHERDQGWESHPSLLRD